MLENMAIVQSAVSSFNNAALGAPSFLWIGLLSMPIFMVVWLCRDVISERLGWRTAPMAMRYAADWFMVLGLLWFIFMGGNYGVLRDAASHLPWVIAVMLFGLGIGTGGMLRDYHTQMPTGRRRRIWRWGTGVFVIAAAALSGYPTWWGALLNAAAVISGVIIGRRVTTWPNTVAMTPCLIILGTVLLLMQPEYFRFGQLGNLTLGHLIGLYITGALSVLAIIVRMVRPANKIYPSAYVKLKWMARMIAALAGVLFILTESVPVFLGAMAAFGILAILGIIHSEKLPQNLGGYVWAMALIAFGVLTQMPVVGLVGVMVMAKSPRGDVWRALGRVL